MGRFCLKPPYAHMRCDGEAARTAAEAARTFLEEHLALVAEPLAARLESCDSGYLALAARALLARTGPRPASTGAWGPGSPDEDPCQGCAPA